MSEIDFFVLNDLDLASNRFLINTILILIVNGLGGFLILRNSAKSLENSKPFLLLTIISSTLMDLHIAFVWGPIPTFPFPGVCSTGFIGRRLDIFWGEFVQHVSTVSEAVIQTNIQRAGLWAIIYHPGNISHGFR